MGVNIGSTAGYFYLDSWIMANIVQLATISFCKRFLNRTNDPCGRQYDQMTQAARSVQANIAEGASRHQTSTETEMKLTDVARASLSELSGDYMSFLMARGKTAWPKSNPNWGMLHATRLDPPVYSDNLMHDVTLHIMTQKKKFDPWLESDDWETVANAMLIINSRLITMLKRQLGRQLETFKVEGGFAENMTQERMAVIRGAAAQAPKCPICGKPMHKVMAKRGKNSGKEFWSCTDYPNCTGTRNIDG